jgi:hypothetical protein
MNKFKVGDEIVRVNTKASWAHIGYTAIVLEGRQYLGKDFCVKRIFDHQWELLQKAAKPKWSIYNNTLPWSELSDKQKGKLLLGRHTKLRFTVGSYDFDNVLFDDASLIYKAIKPEQVKPEPTMAELFASDWKDCLCVGGKQEQNMIAKGWTKSCK